MKFVAIVLIFVASLAMTGCMQSNTSKGTAIGAASGALIGSMTGSWGKGALIGAGVGAVGGYIADQHQEIEELKRKENTQD
jgi:uncharacterized protein YcfJ